MNRMKPCCSSQCLHAGQVEIVGQEKFCSMLVINEESIPDGIDPNPGESNDE